MWGEALIYREKLHKNINESLIYLLIKIEQISSNEGGIK